MKIVVVIPTYNERATIGRLLEALQNEFRRVPHHTFHILVVDGNSPDGTAAAVREVMRRAPNIALIVEEKKQGLGAAYIHGMRHAAEELRADAVVEFDGDFQHDPKDIPRLIAEFDKGYDYVIGSRYVPGGAVPKTWSRYKKFLSRVGGGWFTRTVLHIPVRDSTSGFRLSRVNPFFKHLPLDTACILSKRHAYKVHLLYEMVRAGAKIKEVPIAFLERAGGSSKSTAEDIVETLKVLFALRFRRRTPTPNKDRHSSET